MPQADFEALHAKVAKFVAAYTAIVAPREKKYLEAHLRLTVMILELNPSDRVVEEARDRLRRRVAELDRLSVPPARLLAPEDAYRFLVKKIHPDKIDPDRRDGMASLVRDLYAYRRDGNVSAMLDLAASINALDELYATVAPSDDPVRAARALTSSAAYRLYQQHQHRRLEDVAIEYGLRLHGLLEVLREHVISGTKDLPA